MGEGYGCHFGCGVTFAKDYRFLVVGDVKFVMVEVADRSVLTMWRGMREET